MNINTHYQVFAIFLWTLNCMRKKRWRWSSVIVMGGEMDDMKTSVAEAGIWEVGISEYNPHFTV